MSVINKSDVYRGLLGMKPQTAIAESILAMKLLNERCQ